MVFKDYIPVFRTGDIFMTTNKKIGTKIVQFLQKEPTLWVHAWKVLTGQKINEVDWYHVGMVLNENQIIEQQSKVEIDSVETFLDDTHIVFRNNTLTPEQRRKLIKVSKGDLDEGYGVLEVIAKTITWLTGIKFFLKWLDMPDNAICAIRVAEWFKKATGETFGEDNPNYLTTDSLYEFLMKSKNWEVIDYYGKN